MRVRLIILFAMLVLMVHCSWSQREHTSQGQPEGVALPFEISGNHLLFPPLGEMNLQIRELLLAAAMQKEPLRILHIGDSHVQADLFTGELRRLLSWWLCDSLPSRGIVFPYSVAGTTSPRDFSVESFGRWRSQMVAKVAEPDLFGASGIRIAPDSSSRSLYFRMGINGKKLYPFDRVRLFTHGKGITIANAELLNQGQHHSLYQVPDTSRSFEVLFTNSITEVPMLFGVELSHSQSKLIYSSVGTNGASSASFLKSLNFAQHVQLVNPKLVIVSLGTNDAFNDAFRELTFEANMTRLIGTIRSAVPHALILLTTPNDHFLLGKEPNMRVQMVSQCIAGLAQTNGCAVWDFFSVMGGSGSMAKWHQHELSAPDMLHLSNRGYTLMGQLLFSALVESALFVADRPITQQNHLALGTN